MIEELWIWKSNICRYEGINLVVINNFLDISGKELVLSFFLECSSLGMNLTVTLRLFNSMSLESKPLTTTHSRVIEPLTMTHSRVIKSLSF
jgi:hypothetical protein